MHIQNTSALYNLIQVLFLCFQFLLRVLQKECIISLHGGHAELLGFDSVSGPLRLHPRKVPFSR